MSLVAQQSILVGKNDYITAGKGLSFIHIKFLTMTPSSFLIIIIHAMSLTKE
jgi:hypothetical protein